MKNRLKVFLLRILKFFFSFKEKEEEVKSGIRICSEVKAFIAKELKISIKNCSVFWDEVCFSISNNPILYYDIFLNQVRVILPKRDKKRISLISDVSDYIQKTHWNGIRIKCANDVFEYVFYEDKSFEEVKGYFPDRMWKINFLKKQLKSFAKPSEENSVYQILSAAKELLEKKHPYFIINVMYETVSKCDEDCEKIYVYPRKNVCCKDGLTEGLFEDDAWNVDIYVTKRFAEYEKNYSNDISDLFSRIKFVYVNQTNPWKRNEDETEIYYEGDDPVRFWEITCPKIISTWE